jgi:hypothetical protein
VITLQDKKNKMPLTAINEERCYLSLRIIEDYLSENTIIIVDFQIYSTQETGRTNNISDLYTSDYLV